MRSPVRVPAHAKNNRPASANTAGYDKNIHPPSAGNRSPAVEATQVGGAMAARSCVTDRAHTDIGNSYSHGAEGQFHKGASRRRARRRAVIQWQSPPGRRHMELRSHARNYATRRMWFCEAVFGQEQCQDEGGEVVRAFSFGKGSPASSAAGSPAYACARTNATMGTSMHVAKQRPNPSIERTSKGLRPSAAAHVKR